MPEWRNWQTRMVQVHVLARVWGFESLLRHQAIIYNKDSRGFKPVSPRKSTLAGILVRFVTAAPTNAVLEGIKPP